MGRQNRRNRGKPKPKPKPKSQIQRQQAAQPRTQSDAGLIAQFRREQFSGPLPHPDLLLKYEAVLPGCAERIVKMAEDQSHHRQQLEKVTVEGGAQRANRGLWLGFIITMTMVVSGVALILLGHPNEGRIMVGGPPVALAAVFVYGKRDQRKERQNRLRVLTGDDS